MLQEVQNFQLSPQQKRLWSLRGSNNSAYYAQCAVKIEGNFQPEVLKTAIKKAIARHEILRTTCKRIKGFKIPVQAIKEDIIFSFAERNVENLPSSDKIEQLFEEFKQQNTNTEDTQPLQIILINDLFNKHLMLISLPAMNADKPTLINLVNEIGCSYTACLHDEQLEDLSLQYADFAQWQNELLESEDTETGREYWRKQNFSDFATVDFIDKQTVIDQLKFEAKSIKLSIPTATALKIKEIVVSQNTSISDFFLACWQTLIWRLNGKLNSTIGLSVDGRKYEELKEALGLFAKYLPIQSYLEDSHNINDVLTQVQKSISDINKRQEYFNWEQTLESKENPQHQFFPLCFEFEEIPPAYKTQDISLSIENLSAYIDRFNIKLVCLYHQDLMGIELHYNTNLFAVNDIQRLAEQFQTLLTSLIEDYEQKISKINILSDREHQRLIVDFNKTASTLPKDKCIHHLIEEQAAKTPDNIAVVFKEQQLTYYELNTKANQLAHYLQKLGVGTEVLVGVCLDRSLEMVISLLGVLKAGAAYLPIDPNYPLERKTYILEDAGIPILLTQQHLSVDLPTNDIEVICLDTDWQNVEGEKTNNPARQTKPENLAYVIYTSGSTGKPKGTLIVHRGLLNYLTWCTQAYQVDQGVGTLVHSSLSFDLTITGLFSPLLVGRQLEIISEDSKLESLQRSLSASSNLSLVKITPAQLSLISQQLPSDRAAGRTRAFIIGGENLLAETTSFWQKFAPETVLVNEYGPTETVVGCCIYRVTPDQMVSGSIPIGRPIANTQLYVLDRNLQPLPTGIVGELYIGGFGLARGYLNRSELTAQRFIPNPFSDRPGARLYKTGDLVRHLTDGNLEFLGRCDSQVKIRGFRIELGEIEGVLSQHPEVEETVVVARENTTGDLCLIAYIVSRSSNILPVSELRTFLLDQLPQYAIPSAFVSLNALPLTINGKVDRQALPAPDWLRGNSADSLVLPRSPIEEVILGVWSQILGIQQISVNDNFFELGGHSLLATQVVSRLRKIFSVDLSLNQLFETPTIAGLANSIEANKKSWQEVEIVSIKPVSREGNLPLSFAQQRMWFLAQLEPDSSAYNVSGAIQMRGILDLEALTNSINEIIKRHEILRTNFVTRGETVIQTIAPQLTLSIPIVDLQRETATKIQEIISQETEKPFDLEHESLIRLKLLRLTGEKLILVVTMHHIVSDAWSIAVLVIELTTFYEAFKSDRYLNLPEFTIQYADFAFWQRQWLEQDLSQLEYWKNQLSGKLPVLQLPTDKPRPAIQTHQGASYSFSLTKALTDAVKDLSQKQGVTLFMTLLAAFKVLLYRYSGQTDLIVGSPIANRNLTEIENLLGFFVNTLVLRSDLAENPSFSQFLGQIRQTTLEAYAHQDLPFEKLVDELQPERDLSYNPLFQVMFIFQNAPTNTLELPGLELEILKLERQTAKFDLTLDMSETESGLIGEIEYNTDLFEESTIMRLSQHLQVLLEAIVISPESKLSELPILTAAEQQLFIEWNDTEVAYPTDKCLHQLFEEQVQKTPDAVAVVFESEQLTYRELNAKANQLAHYLQELGVKPEVLVGICVERSLEIVIALLAILKAGGAYVPLDPNYPIQRLADILEDSQPRVLLTQQNLVASLPTHPAHTIILDTDWQLITEQNTTNPESNIITDNLAYVIYTSGSTGKPKGAMIKHSSTVAMLHWANRTFTLESRGGVLASTSICFDLSVFELFLPLCFGGKAILIENALLLSTLPSASEVTLINTVPSIISQLLKNDRLPTSVKTVNIAGEALQNQLVQQLYQQDNLQQVFNLYGPSEDTTYSTYSWSQKGSSSTPPIGRPIDNTTIYLLDRALQPVPVGVPGMIYLDGAGLARGYLNRPEITADRFIPNPLANLPGQRLYKTGDLARYLANGEIEYIGRIDNQVKIRGFRIELGEIETAISKHPLISDCVVVDRQDDLEERRLVAYYIATQQLEVKQLREYLKSKLPDYMIPTAWMQLAILPLTPNGKCDRNSLPIPDFTLTTNYLAPTTPQEEILANIWQEVLNIEQVGIEDNFFESGGHSLIATRAVSQIREIFDVELPLRSLFEHPTIARLAPRVEEAIKLDSGIATTTIKSVPRSKTLPLSSAQQRLWFLTQLEPDSAFYNLPATVRLQGNLNLEALQQSFTEIVRRHELLRTNFITTREGEAQAIILQPQLLTIPLLDLRQLPAASQPAEIRQQADIEAQRPFDLSSDQLIRIKLLHLGEQEHIILLTIHHIIADAWSIDIIVRELATLYQAFGNGQPSPLAELPIQYVDFAAWQRQWLQEETLERQQAYWQEQLANAPKVLELPTDHPRPAIQTFQGRNYSFKLSQELSFTLNKLSQQQGSTLFMTLLAAFSVLLGRYTGSEDLVVGSPIANRNRAEVEGLIGFFVNTLVLRTKLTGDPSFKQLLKRVRETALGAYAHPDLPFELLVEQLQPERDLSYTPIFQVMFVLQNAPMSALELPDLTLTPIKTEAETAKFDLTLYMTETGSGLEGSFEYNTDLFESATIARMTRHLQTLLEAIVANPRQRLSQLPLLTEPEQQQLLIEWNNTKVEYPQDKCIHQLFEEQVERTPDAVAVVFESEQLTYRELNAKANQLAHYLQELGVKPEVLVGICVERSLSMVIGLLAILKAGGAYVPLDPNYPRPRLADILEDSQPRVLLTQQHLLANLPQHQAQIICLDIDWQSIPKQNTVNPVSNITIDHLAYVIYTSGSTGKPKGAMNTHRGIVNRLLWMQDTYQLNIADSILQKTPFSFDVSVWEFFWTLITGARLVVAQPDGHQDPNYLINLISEQQITTVHFVPSMLQAFLEVEGVEKCQSLVRVISSGEALPAQLQQKFFERFDAQLDNLYGPTEVAIDVTFWQCQKTNLRERTIPIGRPIANIQIYLLDRYFNPVPMGATGEVYLGGVGVSRGYLNRADLTAERFIPNPFSQETGMRLYRTGDLARYLPSGDIEYLGRIDHQVKVRGFRIELGEIEVAIVEHPAVRETVVIVREESNDSKRLVAYVVIKKERTLTISALREFLESKLPNYMIPSAVVTLAEIPLTPNGKVDRKALPVSGAGKLESDRQLAAPRSLVETKLTEIWAEVLDLQRVGIFDNFFDLGGDSILAIIVITKANQVGLQLSVKQLFQHQTIADLAPVAIGKKLAWGEQKIITGSTSLTPIQHWFFEQNLLKPAHWNQAVILEVKQVLDLGLLAKTIQQLLLHHDALRLQFEQTESTWQQIITNPDLEIPLIQLDFSALSAREQQEAIEATATKLQASLNLATSPLIRFALFNLGERPSRLLIVIHHLAIDGVSWRILLEDLETVYQQLSQGKKAQLPFKTTSLQYWSERLQEYVQSTILQQEWDYWLKESWQQIALLPVDFSDGDNTVASVRDISVFLTAEQTQTLLKKVPKAYNTQINDVLLTALVQAFAQWTGNSSLLLALEGHGREEIFDDVDLSRTVGWFTSIFPVQLNLGKASNFIEALKLIKDQLQDVPNKGIGYGMLRYLSQDLERVELLRSHPQPQVVFNYLGQFDQTFSNSSIFEFSQDSSGQNNSPQNSEIYLLNINALVINNQLRINWQYSETIHRRSTIEQLAQNFIKALQVIITDCQSAATSEYAASDFPDADLSQQDLDRFLAKIK